MRSRPVAGPGHQRPAGTAGTGPGLRASLRVRDAETLEASWKIAKGYYMYRDKFKFESLDPAFVLKPAVIPAGKKKSDPTFGTVETYINAVTIRLPIGQRASGAQTVKLRISAQGCNEPIGVCYPPMVKELSVSLPPLKVAAAETKSGGVKSLKDLVGLIEPSSNQEFLPPDQAFKLVADVTDANTVTARVRIASGYYLYRDKSSAKLVRGDGLKLGKLDITRGQVKDDPYLGKTEVIHDELSIRIPLERRNTSATDVELEIGYQGCAETGICYPPITQKVSLLLPVAGSHKPAIVPLASTPPTGEGNGYFTYILAAFAVGLLLTFTPCVLPMIPILSGMIVRSGDQTISKLRGLLSYLCARHGRHLHRGRRTGRCDWRPVASLLPEPLGDRHLRRHPVVPGVVHVRTLRAANAELHPVAPPLP